MILYILNWFLYDGVYIYIYMYMSTVCSVCSLPALISVKCHERGEITDLTESWWIKHKWDGSVCNGRDGTVRGVQLTAVSQALNSPPSSWKFLPWENAPHMRVSSSGENQSFAKWRQSNDPQWRQKSISYSFIIYPHGNTNVLQFLGNLLLTRYVQGVVYENWHFIRRVERAKNMDLMAFP